MKLEIIFVLLAIVLLPMIWQHFRYLWLRRVSARDQQNLLHWGAAFHVITFFRVRNGQRLIDTVQQFKQQIMSNSRARLVYAGQAAFSIKSAQLGNRDWDGVLMFQYPSRLDYEQSFADPATCEARELFADSYVHGMRRNCRLNLAIPQFLLRLRLKDIFTGNARVAPLESSPLFATAAEFEVWRVRVARLRALHEINRQGLVIFNLVKRGTPSQQAADHFYGRKMLSRMAALAHGPLHTGRSVALEGGARFDRVHVIHYPGASYFAELLASDFFQSIAGNKQLGDTLMVPTVPITQHL